MKRNQNSMTGTLARAVRLAAAVLLLALGLPVGAAAQAVPSEAAGTAAPQDGGHGSRSTMEMGNAEFFIEKYKHLQPHPVGVEHGAVDFHPGPFTFYDVNVFQLIALGLIVLVFGGVLVSFRTSGGSSWLMRVFRGWCRWIRDEMVLPVMGDDEGRKFTPYFIYLFFFIAFMNLLGLIPGSVTSTACLFVTAALAAVTFVMMVVGGMMQQGVVTFWKNLLPHGLPFWLVPLMFVLEVVGLLVKPFALTIRLFANMLAGHLVIYSFVGMIFLFAKLLEMSPVAYGTAAVAVGVGVFISIIEAFVALLQAYIFTFLSIIFVQSSLHPHH
jgi:F-type H+-transporting ATPase subunit a